MKANKEIQRGGLIKNIVNENVPPMFAISREIPPKTIMANMTV
jgi:hypothetical protein